MRAKPDPRVGPLGPEEFSWAVCEAGYERRRMRYIPRPVGDEPPSVVAFIDLSGRKWEPGLYEEQLRLQLPKDFQLAQNPPKLVAFQLAPPEPAKSAGGTSTQ